MKFNKFYPIIILQIKIFYIKIIIFLISNAILCENMKINHIMSEESGHTVHSMYTIYCRNSNSSTPF